MKQLLMVGDLLMKLCGVIDVFVMSLWDIVVKWLDLVDVLFDFIIDVGWIKVVLKMLIDSDCVWIELMLNLNVGFVFVMCVFYEQVVDIVVQGVIV